MHMAALTFSSRRTLRTSKRGRAIIASTGSYDRYYVRIAKMPGLAEGNDQPASTRDNLGWDFELGAMDRDSDFAALL
jgi:hypothetical protein